MITHKVSIRCRIVNAMTARIYVHFRPYSSLSGARTIGAIPNPQAYNAKPAAACRAVLPNSAVIDGTPIEYADVAYAVIPVKYVATATMAYLRLFEK